MFETHLSTLTTKCPNSILAKMFKSDLMHNEPTQGEVYRLDCDPQCFQVILAWLRHSTISIPATIDIKLVMKAAKQLGLDDLAKQLDKGCDLKGDMTDWLRLNVGGTIFETIESPTGTFVFILVFQKYTKENIIQTLNAFFFNYTCIFMENVT